MYNLCTPLRCIASGTKKSGWGESKKQTRRPLETNYGTNQTLLDYYPGKFPALLTALARARVLRRVK